MKRLIASSMFVLGCFNNADSPADEGACTGLSESDCASTGGCHLVFSFDELCDNLCCASHFDRCEEGATAACVGGNPSGACELSCTQTSAICSDGFAQSFVAEGCCPDGCVALSQCAGVTTAASNQCPSGQLDTLQLAGSDETACDPGELSHYGVQGCPTT
ncbi:MAG TPA: hypothetical protein VH143_01420 [Kofleriaceae bacterium]|jgi:hypothetical protein|nr:hypothetical protein [Kofleriaceae bacterium]